MDIELTNLVNAETNLVADTVIGLLKAVATTEAGEEIIFSIKEQADSDFSKFRLENNSILNNEEIVGDRRFILYLEAKTSTFTFEKSVIFSISAGQIPPENPQDVLLSTSMINENNQENDLIGSLLVVDDSRFDHTVELTDNETYPDNLFFKIEDKKLYALTRFNYELKDSYTINVEAVNQEFDTKKITKEIVVSIGDLAECKDIGIGGAWVHVPAHLSYVDQDFCVMKYEAQMVADLPFSGASGAPVAGGVSQNGAISRCELLGEDFHLISNKEWMAIATNIAQIDSNWTGDAVGMGELVRGHTDNVPAEICGASADELNAYVETSCTGEPFVEGVTTANQRRTHTLSNGEIIWDFAGNVLEFTSYINPDKPNTGTAWVEFTDVTASDTMPLTDLIPQFAIDNMWNSTQSIGKYIAGNPNVGGALQRGGDRASGINGGVFSANMWDGPNVGSAVLGFRCAKSLP